MGGKRNDSHLGVFFARGHDMWVRAEVHLPGRFPVGAYSLDNPLKYAFIAYKYGCRACHSADNFIPAIRYPHLRREHAARCRLPGRVRCGGYFTFGNSVCFCITRGCFDTPSTNHPKACCSTLH